jgi:DNA-binding transcriptional ArsR family regulator
VTNGRVDIDRVFQALGDRTRRAMLDRLCQGPVSVSQLAEPLGITLTAVGQHLEILEACGLAVTEKVGRVRTCFGGVGCAGAVGAGAPNRVGTADGSAGKDVGERGLAAGSRKSNRGK